MFLLVLCTAVMAQIPQKINYQGYLTDGSGAAYDSSADPGGTVQMTFRIHSAVGILWTETQDVAVNNGIYNVVLGSVTPLNLPFNIPYELGVAVGGDPEMSPLQPLTAVPYAFNSAKAGDADTLDGKHGSAFAPSSHPHSGADITTGVVPYAVLPGDIVRQEKVIGIVTENDGPGSGVDADLLDGKDSKAFALDTHLHNGTHISSGTVSQLRIDAAIARDSEVLSIVKAEDGAGSGVDADLLDSMHASDIIDAASDEVRTPVSSCQNITSAGSYYLTGNLLAPLSSNCLNIAANNVTLDMMGFQIASPGSSTYDGIDAGNYESIEIRNGSISGFANGIDGANRVSNVVMNNNVTGLLTNKKGAVIRDCTVFSNTGTGIDVSDSAIIVSNVVYSNGGDGINAGTQSILKNNIVYSNTLNGIYGASWSYIAGNNVYSNTERGIYVFDGSNVLKNVVRLNGSVGIHIGSGGSVVDNTVGYSGKSGIRALKGTLIRGNTLYSNNRTNSTTDGGIYVHILCLVTDNVLEDNIQNGIYVNSRGNVLRGNMVTVSNIGINFQSTGNYYKDNVGTNNNATFGHFVPTGVGDGGGNASF